MRLPGIVVLEGIDACAKTTQQKMLADHLDASTAALGFPGPCMRQSFPAYDTPVGRLIASKLKDGWYCAEEDVADTDLRTVIRAPRELNALVLQALMVANKYELAESIERANVTEGRNVVLSRYIVSAYAYGMADGLSLALLEAMHARLPKAHHVLIDIPVDESFKRRPVRTDAYEADVDRLNAARGNYLHVFEKNGVDTSYWEEERTERVQQGWRSAPSGYAVVNGVGTVDEIHERIKWALGLS